MSYRNFEELEVCTLAREFRKTVHRLIKELPEEEKFDLVSQMSRAATSLANNIAEGDGTTIRGTSNSADRPEDHSRN